MECLVDLNPCFLAAIWKMIEDKYIWDNNNKCYFNHYTITALHSNERNLLNAQLASSRTALAPTSSVRPCTIISISNSSDPVIPRVTNSLGFCVINDCKLQFSFSPFSDLLLFSPFDLILSFAPIILGRCSLLHRRYRVKVPWN